MLDIADKFWKRVDKSGDCWTWDYIPPSRRYGSFRFRGRPHQAHRASWIINNGEIPEGMCVCHHCDNPICVRPSHLFIGTQGDNVRDMIAKGRDVRPKGLRNGKYTKPESTPHGENHGAAKITKENALEIYQARGRQKDIGMMFGVSQQLVSAIKTRRIWKELHYSTLPYPIIPSS